MSAILLSTGSLIFMILICIGGPNNNWFLEIFDAF